MIKKIIFLFQIFVIYFLSINISFADLQTNLINKITATKTLSFNFKQKIAEKEEVGRCFIQAEERNFKWENSCCDKKKI